MSIANVRINKEKEALKARIKEKLGGNSFTGKQLQSAFLGIGF